MAADTINDIGPVDLGVGYGDPGAAQFYGIKKELLRQAAAARQAQLDEEQRQKDALDAEVKREAIASQQALRESQATKNAADANELQTKQFLQTHGVGDTLSPADQQVAVRLFGQGGVTTTPGAAGTTTPAPAGTTMQADNGEQIPIDETMTAPKPDKTTFAGGVEQRKTEKQLKRAEEILNGDHDTGDENFDRAQKLWATETLLSGKPGALPSGLVAPKTATETKAQHDLKMQALETRMTQAGLDPHKGHDAAVKAGVLTAPESAELQTYQRRNADVAETQANRVTNINLTGALASGRQEAGFANAAQKDAIARLDKEYESLNLPRLAKLADTLKTPGGVNDVLATPELLSAMAGGQGAGLRMSQAELNMIQNSRPLLDSLIIKAGNIVGLNQNGYAALSEQQREQMRKLLLEVASNNMSIGQNIIDTQKEINNLKDPSQKDIYDVLGRRKQQEQDLFGERIGVPKPPAGKTNSRYKVTIS